MYACRSRIARQQLRSVLVRSIVGFGFVGLFGVASTARAADATACNNIPVTAGAQCAAVVGSACTSQCQPANFTLACDGKCAGTCNETATTSCTEDCSSWCNTDCTTDPGSFDCQTSCISNCATSCPGKCHEHPSQGQCENSCRTTCDTQCTESCTEVAATDSCETKCGTCCDTSCTVQRNVECEVSCDIQCSGTLQGSCESRCTQPAGALFCDGQFVDAGNDLQSCVDYLESIDADVNIDAWADVDMAARSGWSCTATAGDLGNLSAALVGFALASFSLLRRRSRRLS